MGYSSVPRGAQLLERNFGITPAGDVVAVSFWEHKPAGMPPMWFQSGGRYEGRRIARGSVAIAQYSGASGEARMRLELAESRRLLAESRDAFAAEVKEGGR